MNRAWDEFRTATDPLIVWLDQNTVEMPEAQILQSDLLQAFNKHLVDRGKQPLTKTAFGLPLSGHDRRLRDVSGYTWENPASGCTWESRWQRGTTRMSNGRNEGNGVSLSLFSLRRARENEHCREEKRYRNSVTSVTSVMRRSTEGHPCHEL